MPKNRNTLTNREIKSLVHLADGATYEQIRQLFNPALSLANVHTICHLIRRKTGIAETRDPLECKRYLFKIPKQRIADALSEVESTTKDLTENQLIVFRLMAMGRKYRDIAEYMGINAQSVQNLASRACKRAGIIHAGWNRTKLIKEWLLREDDGLPIALDPMNDPMF